ncbi:MAG TPA: hypothetical protein VGF75_04575, partial [Candidatus Saccharimonadales bacterium]
MSAELIGKEVLVGLAGASSGQLLQQHVYNRIKTLRQAFLRTHPQAALKDQSPNLRSRLVSMHSLLPAAAALAIFNGLTPHGGTVFPEAGQVQATVNQDFGYQLAKGSNGYVLSTKDQPATIEAEVGDQLFGKVANLHMTAVSNNQAVGVSSPNQLNSVSPDGDGSYLPTEVSALLSSGAPKEKLVIIDDGAPIGNITTTGTPIYIANVNTTNSTPAITSSLMDITKATHGQFWSVDAGNAANVANQIAADVQGSGVENNQNNDGNIALLAIGAALLAGEY